MEPGFAAKGIDGGELFNRIFWVTSYENDFGSSFCEGNAHGAVNEIVQRAVADPAAIEREVRPWSESPMMTIWHRSDELTALHIVWPPEVDLCAHDHNMWAVIGI